MAEGRFRGRLTAPGLDVLHGEARSPCYDAVHARRVVFVGDEYWLIEDRLSAGEPHRYDLRFHLAADAWGATEVAHDGRAAIVRAPGLALVFPGAAVPILEDGWVAPEYGRKVPAPVVSVAVEGVANATFLTLVAPLEAAQPAPDVRVRALGEVVSPRSQLRPARRRHVDSTQAAWWRTSDAGEPLAFRLCGAGEDWLAWDRADPSGAGATCRDHDARPRPRRAAARPAARRRLRRRAAGPPAGTRRRVGIDACRQVRVKYRIGARLRVVHRIRAGSASFDVAASTFPSLERSERAYAEARERAVACGPVRRSPTTASSRPSSGPSRTTARSRGLPALAAHAPELAELHPAWSQSELVAYAPEKAATVRCLDAAGRTVGYAKTYAGEEGARARRVHDALARALGPGRSAPPAPARARLLAARTARCSWSAWTALRCTAPA